MHLLNSVTGSCVVRWIPRLSFFSNRMKDVQIDLPPLNAKKLLPLLRDTFSTTPNVMRCKS